MNETPDNPYLSPWTSEPADEPPAAVPRTVKGFIKWLFSFNGRIPRSTFWALQVALLLVVAACVGLLNIKLLPARIIAGVFFLLLIGPMLAVQVKRWHDLDKPGVCILINLIPVFGGLISLIVLGCVPGTRGPNEYGPDPIWRNNDLK